MAPEFAIRKLRLRHPEGFSAERFGHFLAHYRVWRAYVEALIENWSELPLMSGPAPDYRIGLPKLSTDRRVVTIDVRGPWTLGARALIEDACSKLLWRYFPISFLFGLEEGLAEPRTRGETSWRDVIRSEVKPEER